MKKLFYLLISLLIITIGMLQTGCLKDTSEQYPDVTASTYTITGVVKFKETDLNGTQMINWKFGESVINAVVNGDNIVSTAKVEADGTFTLVLPATVRGMYFEKLSNIAYQQGGTIKVTPETVKLFGSTMFKVEYTDNGKAKSIYVTLATHNADLSVNRSYYFNFYDQDGTFTGKGTSGNAFNWTFTKGWGMVESYITNATTNTISSKSVTVAPVNAEWSN